jgi:hypothetical protein
MAASAKKVSRNSPCPCGSGLKYKNCCVGKRSVPGSAAPKQPLAKATLLFAGVIVFALGTLATARYVDAQGFALPPARPAATPTPTPQPWEYDYRTNRHWHAPHGHWHDGPAPAESERAAAAAAPISVPASVPAGARQ